MDETSSRSSSRYQTNLLRSPALFIGRRPQLESLDQSLARARQGHPEVVLIQGEPGVGKTSLLKEARSLALHHKMQVCSGRCYEDVTLPYLPFVDSLLAQLEQASADVQQALHSETEILSQLLGRGAAAPAASFPSFSSQLDQNRLRLFLAVTRITVKLAQQCALLLLLDDLHWADAPSLDLFAHLVFAVGDTALRESVPLAIVGTHRPVEPQSRLSRVLFRLQQEQLCQSLELAGLNHAEVDALMRSLGVARPPYTLVTTICDATRGNPLFVQEVLHRLAQQGELSDRGGSLTLKVSAVDLQLPEHITAAFEARIHTLSENCAKVLILAAFLGEKFSVVELRTASRLPEEDLLDLLEEGVQQQFLLDEGPTFHFTHPLVRQVFYQREPMKLRRQRLHLQIADTLEHLHPSPRDQDLLQIAHHLLNAGATAEVGKVVAYARRAGDHAFAVFAWAEAARFYEAALDTAEATTLLSSREQAELHYLAGLSHYRNMEVGPSLEHHDKAVTAYHASGDLGGVAQTLLEKTRVARTIASVPYGTLAELQPLEHVVQTLGSTDPELCGRIWAQMAQVYWHGRQTDKAEEIALKALAIGRAKNNDRLRAEASFGLGLAHMQKLQLHEALTSWQETCAAAHEINDLLLQGWALSRMSWTLTCQGRLQEAESVAHQACHLIEKTHEWSNYALALANLAVIEGIHGHFTEAEKRVQEALVMVSRSGYPWGGLIAMLALASLQFYRGAWTEAEDTLSKMLTPGHLFADPGSALDIIAGLPRRLVRAYAHTEPELVLPIFAETSPDIFFVTGLCALVDIGDLTNDPTLARSASPMLELAAERGGLVSSGWGSLLPRVLGVIATLDRHWETAEARFQTAISTAEKIGAKPELGRSYFDYARMLVRRNAPHDHQRAHVLAQQARVCFSELGMAPFLQQATQLIGTLQVPPLSAEIVVQKQQTPQRQKEEQDPLAVPQAGGNQFRREGEYWTIGYANQTVRLKDTAGLRFLALLLQSPHQPIPVLKLVALTQGRTLPTGPTRREDVSGQSDLGNAGERVDRQALHAYRQRLRESEEDLEEARRLNDLGRIEKLEEERAFLEDELRKSLGLGGRGRRDASSAERARINVTRAIKLALTRLKPQHPALWRHLEQTIKTGSSCSYAPELHLPSSWQG